MKSLKLGDIHVRPEGPGYQLTQPFNQNFTHLFFILSTMKQLIVSQTNFVM